MSCMSIGGKEARWGIETTLPLELAKTIHGINRPYNFPMRLRKMFVGATELTLVHQLPSAMLITFEKRKNLLTVIEQLKDEFTKPETMGLEMKTI